MAKRKRKNSGRAGGRSGSTMVQPSSAAPPHPALRSTFPAGGEGIDDAAQVRRQGGEGIDDGVFRPQGVSRAGSRMESGLIPPPQPPQMQQASGAGGLPGRAGAPAQPAQDGGQPLQRPPELPQSVQQRAGMPAAGQQGVPGASGINQMPAGQMPDQNPQQMPNNGMPGGLTPPPPLPESVQMQAGPTGVPHLPDEEQPIGEKEVADALQTLTDYKSGKAVLEQRVVAEEQWYKLRHWDMMRRGQDKAAPQPEPASAWLFNALCNKHADAMDNYPEPNCLPREREDEKDAKTLAAILPVIFERSQFEETYDRCWWDKLKHGTAVYGVFWNQELENGLGDNEIRRINLLNCFWEPGVADIQKSRNFFTVELVDTDLLEERYPDAGDLSGRSITVTEYIHDDTVNTDKKTLVVDWYYKKRNRDGRTVLHYCKFANSKVLFATENDPQFRERGWYDHGKYPFVFDVQFPMEDSPAGFGYITICKDPQMYIDKLNANILESSLMATKRRYFKSAGTAVNEQQFLNWNEPIVEVEGSLDDTKLREITVNNLGDNYLEVLQMKINEMKETSSNRDANSGGTSGVTAASAIAAVQEAGNKTSRDMLRSAYRCYEQICYMLVDNIRQFYDEQRTFRITGQNGQTQYADFSGQNIRDQQIGTDSAGQPLYRRPVFDIKISAQKSNPFSKASMNELALNLYSAGFFDPERAQMAQTALDMMEFEGKDKVLEKVNQGQTLENQAEKMSRALEEVRQQLQALMADMGAGKSGAQAGREDNGMRFNAGAAAVGQHHLIRPYGPPSPPAGKGSSIPLRFDAGKSAPLTAIRQAAAGSKSVNGNAAAAQKAAPAGDAYTQKIVSRSKPDMNAGNRTAVRK